MIRYKILLTKEEVESLHEIIHKGHHSSFTFRAAYILLNSDQGEHSGGKANNASISKFLKVGERTIDRVKKRFFEHGLEGALERKKITGRPAVKIDGEVEAHLVKLCCSEPPQGYGKWSLRLLANKMVELEYVESISYVSVRTLLKKTNLSLGKSKDG